MITKIFKFNKLERKRCKLCKKLIYRLVYPWYVISENMNSILKVAFSIAILLTVISFTGTVIYSEYLYVTQGILVASWVPTAVRIESIFVSILSSIIIFLLIFGGIIKSLSNKIKKFIENYGRE